MFNIVCARHVKKTNLALLFLALACSMSISMNTPMWSQAPVPKADVRTLTFPSEHSVGAVDLIKPEAKHTTSTHQVASAKGTVTVSVPPDKILQFFPNQYAVLHPDMLDKVSSEGIDAVKLSFMSMDENEDGLADRAMAHISHFRDATRLDISDSDISDVGLLNVGKMPKLSCIWAQSSVLRGKSLKNIDRFPALTELDFSKCCPFQQSELKNLARIPKLRKLELDEACIAKEGVANLAGCKNLEFLNLNRNKGVNDECMPLLLSMKNLNHLMLQDTSVTPNGIKVLIPLKLKYLSLSMHHYTAAEEAEMRHIFPKTSVIFGESKKVSPASKLIFSPILGHF